MKTAKELYPKCYNAYNYQPMLEEFGEILLQKDEEDYQGDSWIIYKSKEGCYGFLTFGWGSCSGCDALQACDSYEDIENLMQELYQSIIWFVSKEEFIDWIYKHDWEGDYAWYLDEYKTFVAMTKDMFRNK